MEAPSRSSEVIEKRLFCYTHEIDGLTYYYYDYFSSKVAAGAYFEANREYAPHIKTISITACPTGVTSKDGGGYPPTHSEYLAMYR